jgi:TRAP transporter TAXI family solute receptor
MAARTFRAFVLISAVLLGAFLPGVPVHAADEVLVGAGDRTGPYYPVGRSLCRLLTGHVEGLTCALLPTPSGDAAESYSNLVNVQNGAADIALALSDWHHFAVTGSGPLAHVHEKLDRVRSLFSLHGELFTLLVRRDSGITRLDELAGKRVNLGRAASQDRKSIELVLTAKNWTARDFQLAEQITREQQTLAFCQGRIQAMVFTVSHPNDAVRRSIELCNADLLNLEGGAVEQILSRTPYLSRKTIPAGTYPGVTGTVKTFGATITVVTSVDAGEDLVYQIVKAVFDNLANLKRTHAALRDLEPRRMVRDGLTAPYHIGAMRYYREQGWF